jgi:hypothetical protein
LEGGEFELLAQRAEIDRWSTETLESVEVSLEAKENRRNALTTAMRPAGLAGRPVGQEG